MQRTPRRSHTEFTENRDGRGQPPVRRASHPAMDRGDDANEEIEADAIAFRETGGDCFPADAGDADLAVRFVGEPVVHVVRQLAVDADRLYAVHDRVAGPFQHVTPPGRRARD